ncbi:MAG TPA: hypothetical protein VN455_06600 [Methanotrichaceae archaeon]|nr:hypothetical protein [Methanotrichaceae archaeon]
MIDKNGKALQIGQTVRWTTHGWNGLEHEGNVVHLVPAHGHMQTKFCWSIGNKYMPVTPVMMESSVDRVFVAVKRPKSIPLLYCPRPKAVEVIA